MARQNPLTPVMIRLRRPLSLTWAGLIAERLVRAFWPFWTVLAATAAALILGLQDMMPIEVVWVGFVLAGLGLIGFAIHGAMRFRWPRRQEAVDRMELVGHDFFWFINAATDHPSVVYRRKGWDYGVISLTTEASPAALVS